MTRIVRNLCNSLGYTAYDSSVYSWNKDKTNHIAAYKYLATLNTGSFARGVYISVLYGVASARVGKP